MIVEQVVVKRDMEFCAFCTTRYEPSSCCLPLSVLDCFLGCDVNHAVPFTSESFNMLRVDVALKDSTF
jgi:hypothetical protein